MDFSLREGRLADAEAAAKICYEAFKTISRQHNFPPDFGSSKEANKLLVLALSHPDVHSVVAESAGRIVGSNFLWQREAVAAIGPVTVDPTFQNSTVGRRLMEVVLEHARQKHFAGVRLVQAGYHNRSLALYAKLGFEIREPLANLQGPALRLEIPSHAVRPTLGEDVDACNHLYHKIHGHDREKELRYAIRHRTAIVVEHDGRITGYATSIGFSGLGICGGRKQ
jgi:predicted N-acetyltransferase YhbS